MKGELIDGAISHSKVLYHWVNDLEVRNNAFNSSQIEWSDHLKWFKQKISSENTKIFILKVDDNLVGQIRFDLNDLGEWVIDYSIDRIYRGRGFGKYIIQLGVEKLKFYNKDIVAEVKLENLASIQIFSSLGFTQIERTEDCVKFKLKTI